MKRRSFIQSLLGITGITVVPGSVARAKSVSRKCLLQTCELAGYQYYDGERVFPQLRQGDVLTLKRAPLNQYDKRAVEVYWGDSMLGHIPRVGNMAISQMMDRGEQISAKITALSQSDSSWQRIQIAIYLNQD
jgi:hypothetical protein